MKQILLALFLVLMAPTASYADKVYSKEDAWAICRARLGTDEQIKRRRKNKKRWRT